MLDALNYIVDLITSLVNFLVSLITGLIQLITMIPDVLMFINGSVGYLPSLFVTFFSIAITVSVIFVILGRGKE